MELIVWGTKINVPELCKKRLGGADGGGGCYERDAKAPISLDGILLLLLICPRQPGKASTRSVAAGEPQGQTNERSVVPMLETGATKNIYEYTYPNLEPEPSRYLPPSKNVQC